MLKNIFGNIRFRLYGALLLLGLCPTLYTTLRIFFLGQLPDPWAYSIAGQIGWVNLLYEVMNEGKIKFTCMQSQELAGFIFYSVYHTAVRIDTLRLSVER